MNTPCPFCGIAYDKPSYTFAADSGMKYGCRICPNCGACGPDVRTNYKIEDRHPWMNEADRLWNERVKVNTRSNATVYCSNCNEIYPLSDLDSYSIEEGQNGEHIVAYCAKCGCGDNNCLSFLYDEHGN